MHVRWSVFCGWSARVCLAISIGLAPLPSLATVCERNGWRIEKTATSRSADYAKKLTFHCRVTRTGSPVSGTFYLRDTHVIGFTGYGAATPPPDQGGGADSSAVWNLPAIMASGQTFDVVYESTVTGIPDMSILNRAAVLDAASNELASVGYYSQTAGGDQNKTTGANPAAPRAGDPINAATGEYYYDPAPDLNLGGPLPLSFRRHYASYLSGPAGTEDVMSYLDGTPANWMHNFDLRLLEVSGLYQGATVVYEQGKVVYFQTVTNDGGTAYSLNFAQEPVPYELKRDGAGHFWFLDPAKDLVFRFDAAGRLCEVCDRNHNGLALTLDGGTGRVTQVSDGLGRSIAFQYDYLKNAFGIWFYRLAHVSDGIRTVSFGYDTYLRLSSATNAAGGAEIYGNLGTYTPPKITSVTRPAGNRPYTQAYSLPNVGRVGSQTDAYGNTTTIAVDSPTNGFSIVTNADGSVHVFAHIESRLNAAVRDAAGNVWTNEYDVHERGSAVQDRLGDRVSFVWHEPSGKLAAFTNAADQGLRHTYLAQDQTFTNRATLTNEVTFTFHSLAQTDFADGTREQYTRDGCGNVLTRVDRATNTWRFAWNSRSQLVAVTNPAGGVITFAYNPDGTLATRSDAERGTTAYGYDPLFRLTSISNADGTIRRFACDRLDRITNVTDELGQPWGAEYDPNGNLTALTAPDGYALGYAYDLMDRVTNSADSLGRLRSFTYDNGARLASIRDAGGVETHFAYDGDGRMTNLTRAGNAWRMAYDPEGVLTSRTSALGYTTVYQTDPLGMTTAIVDAAGQRWSYARDAMGRLTSVTDPLGNRTEYAYDGAGRLAAVSPPGLGTARYERNPLGQIVRITDLNTQIWSFAYSPLGRLAAATNPLGHATQYEWDGNDRLRSAVFPDGVTVNVRRDAAGRGTNWTYSSGESIAVRRDGLGRLVSTDGLVVQRDIAGRVTNTVDAGVGFGASYDAGRRLATASYSNGAFCVTYTYDAVTGRLVRVADNLVGAQVDFLYDADERLVGIRRANGVHATFTRDAVGRVTRVQDGGILDLRYTLDAAGRVVREERVAPLDPATMLVTAAQTNAVDGACRIIAPGYAWDVRGRLTNAPGRELRWDAASRLTGMNAIAFSYNGLGGLRTRTSGGVTTRFHYNLALALAPVVAERNEATGQFERYYVWTPNGTLLYMIETSGGNQVRYFHFDRSGSTLALTDAAGNVTDAYAYTPFGRLLGHTGTSSQPFTFVGQGGVWMADTNGLYHVRARWYDAQAGRFLTLEPVWPQVEDPQLINPYQYAFNNPISFLDLTGEGALLNDLWRFDERQLQWNKIVSANAPSPEPSIRNGMWVYDKENRQWSADEGMLNWNRISREPARPSPFEKAMDQEQKRLWKELFDNLAGRREVPRRKPDWVQEVWANEVLNNLRFRHYEPQGLPVTAKIETPRLPVEIHGAPDEANARPLSLDDLALAAQSVSGMDPELFKNLAREAGLDSP